MSDVIRPKILVVDDDLTVGLLAREALTQAGFDVSLAQTAAAMHQQLEMAPPDILLLDVQLPDGSGIELCMELRASSRFAHIPILMITGSDDNTAILLAYGAGATDFMPKPFNWNLMVQRVRYMWRSHRTLLKSQESERLLNQAQFMAKIGSWERNLATGAVTVSAQFMRFFGNPEWSNKDCFLPFLDTIPAEEKSTVTQIMSHVTATGEGRILDHHVQRPDGALCNVRHRLELRLDPAGRPEALCGTIQDITRDKLRSQLATDRNHILEQTLLNADITDFHVSLDHLLANQIPGCETGILTLSESQWRCDYCSRALRSQQLDGELRLPETIMHEVERSGKTRKILNFDLTLYPQFGPRHARLSLLPITVGRESRPTTLICVFVPHSCRMQDATHHTEVFQTVSAISAIALDNYRLSRDLRYQAFHDSLTGLPNRFLFLDRLNQAVAEGKRTGSKRALFCIDLDRFKNTNDLLGHGFGDKVLREMAKRLREILRQCDTLARMGGDEFMLLSAPLESYDEIEAICGRVMETLSQPFEEDSYRINLGASIGVSLFPADSQDAATLYQHADVAMQHAKKSGGNVFKYYDGTIMTQFLERLELENDMPRALEQGEFHLVFQPQVETASNRIVSYEALLRWRKPDGTYIPPSTFISIAEESGFIVTLGTWVLTQACLQIGRLHKLGATDLKIAVNVSTVQFVQDNFLDQVRAVIKTTDFPANRLEIEVTESAVMHDMDIVAARLNALRALGITVAIDDFGTGYSSMSYLKSLPIDCLKIDRCFIAEIGSDAFEHKKSQALVDALINLADNLGLSVVAEGVENRRQLEFLRQKGCTFVQGYYTGKPGPLPENI